MKFNSRREALMVLGLDEKADMEAIKSAYKSLVKLYHPDVRGDVASRRQYQAISDAYEYLTTGTLGPDKAVWAAAGADNMAQAGHRIFGTKDELNRMAERMRLRADYARQETKTDNGKKRRADELSQKARQMRQDKAFNDAMNRIHTERAAEGMAQIIRAYLANGSGGER